MDSLLTAAVFLLAGATKGLIGLGLPTVSVGLLALLMPPVEAAALLLVPAVVTNIVQIRGPALHPILRRIWPMLLAMAPATLVGSATLTGGGRLPLGLLGLALILYAAWGLLAPPLRLSPRAERWSAVPIGLANGAVTGATGVAVMPAVPWLGALGLTRDEMVQALGLAFLVATIALGAALAWQGAITPVNALGSLLALPPALAGQWLGTRLRGQVSPARFRTLFFAALLALGAQLAWRGFG